LIDSIFNIFITGLIGIALAYIIPLSTNTINYIALMILGFLSISFIYIFVAINYVALSDFRSWGKVLFMAFVSLFPLAISFYTLHLFRRVQKHIKILKEEENKS
jgi:hypothetical protein